MNRLSLVTRTQGLIHSTNINNIYQLWPAKAFASPLKLFWRWIQASHSVKPSFVSLKELTEWAWVQQTRESQWIKSWVHVTRDSNLSSIREIRRADSSTLRYQTSNCTNSVGKLYNCWTFMQKMWYKTIIVGTYKMVKIRYPAWKNDNDNTDF